MTIHKTPALFGNGAGISRIGVSAAAYSFVAGEDMFAGITVKLRLSWMS